MQISFHLIIIPGNFIVQMKIGIGICLKYFGYHYFLWFFLSIKYEAHAVYNLCDFLGMTNFKIYWKNLKVLVLISRITCIVFMLIRYKLGLYPAFQFAHYNNNCNYN